MTSRPSFTSRYHHVQEGLLQQARWRLEQARQKQSAIEAELAACARTRAGLCAHRLYARAGSDVRALTDQIQTLEWQEQNLRAQADAAKASVEQAEADVLHAYRERERWGMLAQRLEAKVGLERQRIADRQADERALVGFRRSAP
ncbi:MAG: hypothetical protein K6T78_07600 [Alicyclobacillus sp.]|nr:hypothetical protein [Alicyclobacillus sp.]